jgi:hypothetical protein
MPSQGLLSILQQIDRYISLPFLDSFSLSRLDCCYGFSGFGNVGSIYGTMEESLDLTALSEQSLDTTLRKLKCERSGGGNIMERERTHHSLLYAREGRDPIDIVHEQEENASLSCILVQHQLWYR